MTLGFKPLVATLLGATVLVSCSQSAPAPEPGTDLYAIAPEGIIEVLFSSPGRKLYAFRWSPGEAFQIVTSARGGSIEQCTGGDAFLQWLRALAKLPVVKRVEKPFDEGTPEWADLRLRDDSQLEAVETRLRIPTSAREPVVIQYQTSQFSVAVDSTLLRRVEGGCAAMGGAK